MNTPHAAGPLPPLPPQPLCLAVLREKYLQPGESGVDDVFDRVARALAAAESPNQRAVWAARFRAHLAGGAIGAGRIMATAGTRSGGTWVNCFVQPVGDGAALDVSLREAAETLRRGGGVGYDFSRLPPANAGGAVGGPCAAIDRFDRLGATVRGIGARRGAQMAVLRIDHPDVLDFIAAKRTPGRWTHLNVSVGVTDAFMAALQADADGARTLWDALTRAAYDSAEPGVLFLDTIARDNNLRAIECLEATNPCGEEPLPPYGGCCLGPVILPRFVRHPFGHGGTAAFDFDGFAAAVGLHVRLLDNVLDLTSWPVPPQQAEAQAKRRIGVGFTGLADALILLRLRYDREDGRAMARRIAQTMRDAAYRASVALARDRGAFPRFDAATYLAEGTFASRLPPHLQAAIREYGIRNSHLLSIAPAGTVSLAFADNASNGIEPVFAWTATRRTREADGRHTEHTVHDPAWRLYRALFGAEAPLTDAFVTALDIAPADHVAMVAAVQPCVDAGIAKTVNVPADCPYETFRALFGQAWRAGLKGLTAYRPNAIRGAVLTPAAAPCCALTTG